MQDLYPLQKEKKIKKQRKSLGGRLIGILRFETKNQQESWKVLIFFIQVEATMKGFYDTHNHLDEKFL